MASNLSVRLLGDCDQGQIDEFQFYAGENRTLKLQVYDTENDQKYCLPTTVSLTIYLPSTSGTDIEITNADITIDTDRSIISAELSTTQTTAMMTGWIKLQIDDSGAIRWAIVEFGTTKLSSHT